MCRSCPRPAARRTQPDAADRSQHGARALAARRQVAPRRRQRHARACRSGCSRVEGTRAQARSRRPQPELVVLRGHDRAARRRDRVHRELADAAVGAVLHGVGRRAGPSPHRRQRARPLRSRSARPTSSSGSNDNFNENGCSRIRRISTPSKKYPLVLLIHGGPRAASLLHVERAGAAHGGEGLARVPAELPRQRQPRQRVLERDSQRRGRRPGPRRDGGHRGDQDSAASSTTSRMAVSGWSYGGYMTTWMLGHYDIWKAAVAGASVTNQLDQYKLSDGAGGGRGNNSPWVSQQAMDRMRAAVADHVRGEDQGADADHAQRRRLPRARSRSRTSCSTR